MTESDRFAITSPIISREFSSELPPLRPKQSEGLTAVLGFLEAGNRRGYIHHPTGYGKTRLMAEIAARYGGRHVWMAPGIGLADQTRSDILDFDDEADVGVVDGDRKEIGHQTTVITPDSLESAKRRFGKDETSSRIVKFVSSADLALFDEVHHFLTEGREKLVNLFANSVVIGATATDKYSDRKSVERKFGPLIHEVTIEEAIEEGALTHVRLIWANTGQSLEAVRSNATGNGDFNPADMEKYLDLGKRDHLGLAAYKELLSYCGRRMPTIAFCITRNHAAEFAERARASGFSSEVMTGETDVKARNDIWERVEAGETEIVSSVNVLNEGLNRPFVEVGMMLRPTRSKLLARQRLGRFLRQSPSTGKKFAYAIELFDDLTESSGKASVTVPNLFNIYQFKNGGVITDRTGQFANDTVLDGIPIREEIQRTPSYDGVLGRIDRVQEAKDKLDKSEVDELRDDLYTLLTTGGWSEQKIINFPTYAIGGITLWHNDKPVSVSSLIRRFSGNSRNGVTQDDFENFLYFVFGEDKVKGIRGNREDRGPFKKRYQKGKETKGADLNVVHSDDKILDTECQHHWVIGGSNGGRAMGVCKKCGSNRGFVTRYEGYESGFNLGSENPDPLIRDVERVISVRSEEEF